MPSGQLARASFTVNGDTLVPDFWTAYFGIEPSLQVAKGKLFRTPLGQSRASGRTGVWSYSSRSAVHDDALDPHVSFLIARLCLPRTDLPLLLSEKGATMRVFCYWNNYTGGRTPIVSPSSRTAIQLSGGTVDIDEYPQKVRVIGADGIERDEWV